MIPKQIADEIIRNMQENSVLHYFKPDKAVRIGPPVKLTVKRPDPTAEELLLEWPLGAKREMMIQTGEGTEVKTFIKTSESISLEPDENGKYPATFEFTEDLVKEFS